MDTEGTLNRLRTEGFAAVGQLSAPQVAEVVAHLQRAPAFPDCHVRNGAGPAGSFASYRNRKCVCHHHHDVLTAPHLLELALGVTDVAAAWLELDPPILYSCNAFWTRPGGMVRPDIQDFHRDKDNTGTDSEGFLPLFVLLTDVTEEDGAQELMLDGRLRRIFGPAGTAFLSNTALLHRGLQPRLRERGIVWFRWGRGRDNGRAPWAYEWDRLTPLDKARLGERYPRDPRLQQSIRLLAQ